MWVNRTANTSVRDTSITPTRTGLGIYQSLHNFTVFFDNLLITINAPPWFVNVTSVPPGWKIVLKNRTGGVVSEATSINGSVSLGVWDYFIVENAVLEVYNEEGSLVASRWFEYVMGGEVYRVVVRQAPEGFTGLAVGIGGSNKILLYNLTSLGNISFIREVSINSVFDGKTSVAFSRGSLYLLNTSGVYRYDFSSNTWSLVTTACRSSGLGAGLAVVNDAIVVVPGVGNNSLCVYNATSGYVFLHGITEGVVTEYTCTASGGDRVYVSLLGGTGPIIVVYRVSSSGVSTVDVYGVHDYRLYGLTHDGSRYLYFTQRYSSEYGVVYRLDTSTRELRALPILLYPTPYTLGNRLVYYSNHLIYARGDETNELYLVPLEYAFW